ncbi:MAG TPA: hypothetical protein VFB72_21205 [Verrucomicrobiae bacterium]|nr:hypothetical protein [Verrucomicrobiae bacterium]
MPPGADQRILWALLTMHNVASFRFWSASIVLACAVILNWGTAFAHEEGNAPIAKRDQMQLAKMLAMADQAEKLVVATGVTNGNITFSWRVEPGKWQLYQQQPPNMGEWQPTPAAQYRTNNATVFVTLPLPRQTTLYRVSRLRGLLPPTLPNFPPIPPPPTKRPPKLKRPHS